MAVCCSFTRWNSSKGNQAGMELIRVFWACQWGSHPVDWVFIWSECLVSILSNSLKSLCFLCVWKVANKLYLLSYISGNIEQYATDMLLSAVDQRIPDIELSHSVPGTEQKVGEVWSITFFFYFLFAFFFLPSPSFRFFSFGMLNMGTSKYFHHGTAMACLDKGRHCMTVCCSYWMDVYMLSLVFLCCALEDWLRWW